MDTKSDILLQLTLFAVVVGVGIGVYFIMTMMSKRKGGQAGGPPAGGIKLSTVGQTKKQMVD